LLLFLPKFPAGYVPGIRSIWHKINNLAFNSALKLDLSLSHLFDQINVLIMSWDAGNAFELCDLTFYTCTLYNSKVDCFDKHKNLCKKRQQSKTKL